MRGFGECCEGLKGVTRVLESCGDFEGSKVWKGLKNYIGAYEGFSRLGLARVTRHRWFSRIYRRLQVF